MGKSIYMNKCILFLCIISVAKIKSNAQFKTEVKKVLQNVNNQLNSNKIWSYYQKRETRYYGENYHNITEAKIYFEINESLPAGFKFRAIDTADNRTTVSNGKTIFYLDDTNKTIDTAKATSLNGGPLLHSIVMLKNALPWLITYDSMNLQMTDTIIGIRSFYKISIWSDSLWFNFLKGVRPYKSDALQLVYHLVVDKKTLLPFQFIMQYRRGVDRKDDKDFLTVTYYDLKKVKQIGESYWQYATYATKYSPYIEKPRNPRIKPGTAIANFKLPAYTAKGIDTTIFSSFKGKIVLLDFWFKSCGPCMQAMPHFNELQEKFGKQPFQLVSINVEDGVEDIKFFYNKLKPSYPMLFMGKDFFNNMGYYACPTSMLLDAEGKIIKIRQGFDKEVTEKDIEEALSGRNN